MTGTLIRVFILTIVWAALQGSFSVVNLGFGAVLGFAVVGFSGPLYRIVAESEETTDDNGWRSFLRAPYVGILLLVFLRELLVSSVRVAAATLRPNLKLRSAVVAYPLDVTTDVEITVLSNLITLTPGTMTLDVSNDRTKLYIHAFNTETDDGAEVIDDIKSSLEKHVARALGPRD